MDQKQIDALVREVMSKLEMKGNTTPFSTQTNGNGSSVSYNANAESCSIDLGSEEAKNWIGVQHPKSLEVLQALKASTATRVGSGRAGVRPRTCSLLRFLADHSRSKDTVLKEVPAEWIQKHGLLEVQSEITDKDQYLTRPDMGRVLSKESIAILQEKCKKNPQVQVIISDGLSTDAITVNYDELLPPLLSGLQSAGLDVGTPFFVRYGRVKIEDQIGELLGAKAVVLLVGERPGLGQSESLSCYAVYSPTAATVEADRTCISNIHKSGTPPVEAAAVIVDLVKRMLEKKASGINLIRG